MISEISILNIILISVCSLSLIIQLFFYAYLFPKTWRLKSDSKTDEIKPKDPVSVIIAARNEAGNIKKNLLPVLSQKYPEYEVIVVCDHSTDNSEDVLAEFQKSYKNLKVITDNGPTRGKKTALSLAINASSHERLVFTDADCRPSSGNWLAKTAGEFSDTKQLILGYGGYIPEKSLLNAFIRYDTSIIALQYFGAALSGKAYMGVGRNMAYTKTLWNKAGGFSSHENIASGDDDLFVISASTMENTTVCLSQEAFTFSEAKKTWKSFLDQKARHISTSVMYSLSSKFYSGAELFSRATFFLSILLLLISGFYIFSVTTIILRFIYLIITSLKLNKTLKSGIPVFYIILFDIFAPFFYGFLVLYKLLIHSNKQW